MAALVLCASTSASAQLANASPGIRIGDGALHFFLEGDARYDSLVKLVRVNGQETQLADIVIHVRPGLRFGLLNPSTAVNFTGSGEVLYFTQALNSNATPLRFQANVTADAAFNKDGAVEVQVSDALSRSDRTQNPAVGVGVQSLFNNVRLAVPIHPGGRALEITPSVGWGIEFFDCLTPGTSNPPSTLDCTNPDAARANYSNVTFGLNGRWKFLPKTAVVVDVASDIRTYFDSNPLYNRPATLLRAQAGLMGLISTHFNVTVMAGYAHDFAGTNLNNVIGQAEVGYSPNEMIRLALGYLRTTLPVPGATLGNFIDDRPYLRGTVGLWAGRLTLNAGGSLDLLNYYYATNPRTDYVVAVNAGATVIVLPWVDISAAYGLGVRWSSIPPTTNLGLNTTRHEVTLRLGVHY